MGAINGQAIKTGLKIAMRAGKHHLPSILITAGLIEMGVGAVKAVYAAPKAFEELDEQRGDEVEVADLMDREPKKDIWARTKIIAKNFGGSATIFMAGALCVVAGHVEDLHRIGILATAGALKSKEIKSLKDEIVKLDGDKTLTKINDNIAEKNIQENPVSGQQVIVTGRGDHLCYDAWSGRYFYTSIEKVQKAVNELNRTLLKDGYFSLNVFDSWIGLPEVEGGGVLGWKCSSLNDQVDINFSSKITDSGEPCLIIRFDIMPEYEFSNYG